MKKLESNNKQSGFYGTRKSFNAANAEAEWAAAFKWVAKAMPEWSAKAVRNFLDSESGRRIGFLGSITKQDADLWMHYFKGFAEAQSYAKPTPEQMRRHEVKKPIAEAKKALEIALFRMTCNGDGIPSEFEAQAVEIQKFLAAM